MLTGFLSMAAIGNFHAAIVDEDADVNDVKEKRSNGNQRQNMSDDNTSSKIIGSGLSF